MTPAASKAIPYQPQHVSPASPRAVYTSSLEQYRPVAHQQQQGPASVYSARTSSVSPTGPHTYSRQRYPSTHDFPNREPVEHTAYLTPQSPRRMSYAHAAPQAWSAQVPQNYVFTAQNAPPPAGPPPHDHVLNTAQPIHQAVAPIPVQAPYATPAQHYQEFAEHDVKRQKMAHHPEEVKIQLENFDLETALIHISDRSKSLYDFSQHYCQRAHQTQRSGLLPGSTPNLAEIQDMLRHGDEIHHGLCRLHQVLSLQQAALAERSKEQMQKSIVNAPVEDVYAADHKDLNISADNKKRRGRAAPPGRCHSCNRAETPEWRRGPDGARTLCNACGLRTYHVFTPSPLLY
jgi:hypothetical protein